MNANRLFIDYKGSSSPSSGSWSRLLSFIVISMLATLTGCGSSSVDVTYEATPAAHQITNDASTDDSISHESPQQKRRRQLKFLNNLSEYNLFKGALADHDPAEGVVAYSLNSPLFTDYAIKSRFIKLPKGTSVPYNAEDVFEFPVGTIIAKSFAHDIDMTDPSRGRRLIETRILLRQKQGWIGLPYVWNEEQTEATLSVTGANIEVGKVLTDGSLHKVSHLVPNMNDCKRCHVDQKPIGPKARFLNGDFAYEHGVENQLEYWSRSGILDNAPKPDVAPRLAIWNDESSGTLDERARSWLEINCAHCHSPDGPARNS